MKKFLHRIRRGLADALAGRKGRHAQQLAWQAARLHPVLRAAREIKQGHIQSPLATLTRSRLGFDDVRRLRVRLADMDSFCRHAAAATIETCDRGSRASYNGRVLFALHSCGAFDPTGYASRSMAMIFALEALGVAPVIAVRPGYPWDLPQHRGVPKADQVEYRGRRFLLEPDPPLGIGDPESRYIEHYAQRIEALAVANDASVIHAASNYLNGAAAAAASRKLGIASIYEVRGLWHLTRAFSEPGYAATEHYRYCEMRELAACAEVDHVVTLSGGLRQWLIERGIAAHKISIVGNAAHAQAVEAVAAESVARAVRARHSIPNAAKVIGYLGAIVEYEGLDALVRAHARTPEACRPYLLLVGGGAQEATLRHLVDELGTRAWTVFAGRVPPDQVSAHYAAMDAVVLPRRDDILTRLVPAIKPFEVLAHARPLFVSPALARALADTLPEGYEVLDVDALDRLDRVFDSPPSTRPRISVPTWNDRARAVLGTYRKLTTGETRVSECATSGESTLDRTA